MHISSEQIGFYGKLPSVGDFVRRQLSQAFVTRWCEWLEQMILTGKTQWGEVQWRAGYIISPAWRFVLNPDICGNKAVVGIFAPSIDRVGRCYPLTLAVQFESTLPLSEVLLQGEAWFEALEKVASTSIKQTLSIEEFEALLKAVPPLSLTESTENQLLTFADQAVFKITLEQSNTQEALARLNSRLLKTFMPQYSLWQTVGRQDFKPTLISCEGLPAAESFGLFLNQPPLQPLSLAIPSSLVDESDEITQPGASSVTLDKPPSTSPHWQSWGLTNIGKRRKCNEDTFLSRPDIGLWAVADGMGGHKAGDVASQLLVERLKEITPSSLLSEYIEVVNDCIQKANTELCQLSRKSYDNQVVGSTVVALLCPNPQEFAVLWAGDSRLYLFRNNALQQVTRDHSVEPQTEETNRVKSINIITRAVGADDTLLLDTQLNGIEKGDVFLLCSDGLDKELSMLEIESILQTQPLQECAAFLMQTALSRKARDNITVIVVTYADEK